MYVENTRIALKAFNFCFSARVVAWSVHVIANGLGRLEDPAAQLRDGVVTERQRVESARRKQLVNLTYRVPQCSRNL